MQPPSSTSLQHHNGLLAEYGCLLAQLSDAQTSAIPTDNTFLSPSPFSPLARELECPSAHVERLMQSLGGQPRADRLLSLTQILKYYGLAVAPPQNTASLAKVMSELQERCAIHRLSLEQGIDLSPLLSAEDHLTIINEISLVLGDEETPIIDRLAREAAITIEQWQAAPNASLERLLDSQKARYLGKRLIDALDWYGARSGHVTAPNISTQLLAEALRTWYLPLPQEPSGTIVGYRLQQPCNLGKSYQSLRSEFEEHLLESGRVTTALEKIVLARLLLRQFPVEFQVRGIPADLPYASSVVWVNFVHGAHLAHAIDPGLLQRLTFQQLIDFPLEKSTNAPQELLDLIALTRAPAAHAWAQATGSSGPAEDAEEHQLARSIAALEAHTTTLNNAIVHINAEPPQRLTMAKRQLARAFGNSLVKPEEIRLMRDDGYAGKRDKRHIIDTSTLPGKTYPLLEVYASGGLSANTRWYVSNDGKTRDLWISLGENRQLEKGYSLPKDRPRGFSLFPGQLSLPDIQSEFDTQFSRYLDTARSAYETLIKSQLVTLPWAARKALEHGEVRVFTLRNETHNVAADDETAQMTLPLRARKGFVLQATYLGAVTYYECLPRAGILRERLDIPSHKVGGVRRMALGAPDLLNHQDTFVALRSSLLPFDWPAHANGTVPKRGATCYAIFDQLGSALSHRPIPVAHHEHSQALTLDSPRTQQIAAFISTNLFHLDEKELRASAWGETEFERDRDKEHWIYSIKPFVPFWGSVDDLRSDNFGERVLGVLGLIVDTVSFAVPLGKFAAGSIRLTTQAGRMGIRATLPSMARLTTTLLTSSLKNLNPLDGLLKSTSRGLRTAGRAVVHLERKALFKLKKLAGNADQYDLSQGLAQFTEPGQWKALAETDQLAIVKGLEDVPVRKVTGSDSPHYLIDPLSSQPYGPPFMPHSGDLSLGRSGYPALSNANDQSIVELALHTRLREVLEIDGRTTLFIDDVPYRLEGNELRHADLTQTAYTRIACRVPRAPSRDLCQTSYVLRAPAPTPDIGSFDATKGWAPWFGDISYTTATDRGPLPVELLRTHASLAATLEFQKGIYGRVMVSIPVPGQELVDTFRTGTLLVEAQDGSSHYLFTRLDAGEFYVAELAKGQSMHEVLTFKKANTLAPELQEELKVVYTGSLNANNMVRIHGQDAVERALKAMDEIAIPIGGPANPPNTLKWLKVDTSPAEAVMFDHSSRMIVRSSSDGAATWSLSKAAPDNVRETTAQIFNTLFDRQAITLGSSTPGAAKALKIDDTMMQLQRLISRKTRRPVRAPRNIAFAEINTQSGGREVYVSVSGRQGDTGFLPLFAKNKSQSEVVVGNTRYFNIDRASQFPETALDVTPAGKLQAIPHTISNIETYTPALTSRPTSLDTESKLISYIRGKYPDPKALDSIVIATTMAPCDSCSVVMKQFAYDGSPNALDVIWK